jgi:hypothetical protein
MTGLSVNMTKLKILYKTIFKLCVHGIYEIEMNFPRYLTYANILTYEKKTWTLKLLVTSILDEFIQPV